MAEEVFKSATFPPLRPWIQGEREDILDQIHNWAVDRYRVPLKPTWFPQGLFYREAFGGYERGFVSSDQTLACERLIQIICPHHVERSFEGDWDQQYFEIEDWFFENGQGYSSPIELEYDSDAEQDKVLYCFSDAETAVFFKLQFG